MCKSKMAINASDPNPVRTPRTRSTQSARTPTTPTPTPTPTTRTRARTRTTSITSTSSSSSSTSQPYASTSSSGYSNTKAASTSSTISSRTSLSSLRESLPENPHIYDISEIRSATNNFLAKRYSSSSTASWRCNLRGRNTIIFQRKFRRKIIMDELKERLSVICRSHHMSIVKLLGSSISGDHIYLVYEYIEGANLADCLRSKNPNFTVLATWISRMQIATDLAHGVDYIHNNTGLKMSMSLVHNHIKSSSIIVTEPSFNAKICHFGTAQLCGEINENESKKGKKGEITTEEEEKEEAEEESKAISVTRSNSGIMQFEGVRGYMSPEYQATGIATQKADVYSFGVIILELLSGEEPLKYKFDKSSGDFIRTSIIETAKAAIDGGNESSSSSSSSSREGRLRQWVDRRLKDSFPVEVAEKVTRLALDCVHVDPDQRPNMGRVAGKISKLYLDSRKWSDIMKIPTGISVSLAPRD